MLMASESKKQISQCEGTADWCLNCQELGGKEHVVQEAERENAPTAILVRWGRNPTMERGNLGNKVVVRVALDVAVLGQGLLEPGVTLCR